MSGKVYLVGAGPGDPGLLTLKGRACLEAADVVLYDRLVSPEVLAFARPGAERVYVGKEVESGASLAVAVAADRGGVAAAMPMMDAGLRPADATYGAPGAVTRHGLGDTLRQALPDALRHAPGGITRHHTLADATREPDPRQAEIHRLMIRHAQAGRTVVRLKGGDPFVFGRGGEEATVLRQHGIPFEIVPGVSSAVAVPAYAGIPLTYRGLATGFTVVTGHEALHSTGVAWDVLARSEQTLVILMGVGHLAGIVERLIAAGRDRETPAAVIASGTTQRQRSVVTTLGEIDAAVRRAGIRAPAVVVIGPVARLAEHLAWFSPAPPVAPQAGAPQAGAPRTAPPPAAAAPQAAAPPRR